jgi:hypothetical protein
MVVMAVLLTVGATRTTAFKAFDCNNGSAPIEQYSLLDPEPCGNMQKVHAIKRDLHREIVQIKKKRLIQVTKCIVFQTIMAMFCGFQSRAGVPNCTPHSPPTAGFRPSWGRSISAGRSILLNGCQDRLQHLPRGRNGCPGELRGRRVQGQRRNADKPKEQALYEVDIKQEWAQANDLTGTIKLKKSLVATTTDRATVDSGEGTYVWDF